MLVFRTDGCLSISKPRTIYDFLSVLIATASHAQDFFSSTYASLLFSPFPMLLFSSTYESSAVSLHPWPRTAHVGSTHRHNSSRARGGSVGGVFGHGVCVVRAAETWVARPGHSVCSVPRFLKKFGYLGFTDRLVPCKKRNRANSVSVNSVQFRS